jgi:glycosyltransferase 2 family protein
VGSEGSASGPARLFARPPGAPRFRRPTDVLLLAVTTVTVLVTAVRADQAPSGLEAAVVDVMANLPGLLRPVWQIAVDLLLVYALLLVVAAAFRRQASLLRDVAVSLVAAVAAAVVVGRLALGDWPDLVSGFVHDDPADFPALGLVAGVTVFSVVSPHVARPFRYAGRGIVTLAALGTAALGIAAPWQTVGALALGWAVAAAVHLAFGSPGGLPSLDDVRLGLAGIGVDGEPIDVHAERGVVRVDAKGPDGTGFDVKVHGRDAWDGQLLVTLWRFLWYRDSGSTLTLSRLQQVEHEAFVTLLAERRGARVAPVVAAGVGSRGDALLVSERVGLGLAAAGDEVDDGVLEQAWHALDLLHGAGITHGAIEPERVRVSADGAVTFSDLASAEVTPPPAETLIDRAQLLVSIAVVVGIERSVRAALAVLGEEGFTPVTSYLQPAAISPALRRQAAAADLDVDALRAAAVAAVGGEEPELQQLRRLSAGRVAMGVLLFIAASALVSSLTDIGLDTILDAVAAASVPILLLAFVIGQTPRVVNAFSLAAAAPTPVPFGRLVTLQFAITFVNLAMPSTAARVAVNVRFFQRNGVGSTAAVTIGALDGFTGFVAQITLLLSVLLLGLGTLELRLDETLTLDGGGGLLVWLLVLLVAVVATVLIVGRLRRALVALVAKVWGTVRPLLRQPARLLTMLAANLAAELLFALCMYTVLRAFGQDVAFADVVVVNVCVALFAGLMPVPGGIGVSEAALTAGFVALGVDEATAFAAAITYRVVTFYLPPVLGVFAFRWLQRQRFL